ncbi:hypothetical protein Sliba_13910 [Streptomyces nigrescens]|uniref:MftR C-terminal domain-containing protein n=1 Tax=Streptomyces nigrescens TaxID=1920 RepID=A0A640TC96_STRNI|nr:hypothetical protein Sliba_13910 [Streptomyces libani subsp. libani]GGV88517.1 hypothetical protein GCM10010500_11310 [Streptomyces libani subsp. libani]
MGTEQARRLVRGMGSVPAIWMRWLAAGREMQDRLLPALAARKGAPESGMEVRLPACALRDAIGVAMEHWAWQDEPEDVAELTRRALRCLRIRRVVARWPGPVPKGSLLCSACVPVWPPGLISIGRVWTMGNERANTVEVREGIPRFSTGEITCGRSWP